jgi:hypothetical protein
MPSESDRSACQGRDLAQQDDADFGDAATSCFSLLQRQSSIMPATSRQ